MSGSGGGVEHFPMKMLGLCQYPASFNVNVTYLEH